ncbi:zyxin isoform X2 [Drosophila eugracilis]|uniref:zyxin isoform X2 n=1 Tax=Drosophila eugracilis TaxID=29029 RepID=UPI0007E67D18|nr:zyxin isoform X2 [Drosophila eugracilis]
MQSLDQQLQHLSFLQPEASNSSASVCIEHGKVAELVDKIRQKQRESYRRIDVPPKLPKKYNEMPQVPLSKQVSYSREPLYSQPLIGIDKISGSVSARKQNKTGIQTNGKTTLDNPAMLQQQLETLAYHKLQMEKKGLLGVQIHQKQSHSSPEPSASAYSKSLIYKNLNSLQKGIEIPTQETIRNTYSMFYIHNDDAKAMGNSSHQMLSVSTNLLSDNDIDDEAQPPPSPESAVSSSYSELFQVSSSFNKPMDILQNKPKSSPLLQSIAQHNDMIKNLQSKTNPNYYCYGGLSQSSLTYDSIYEPINPRPSGDMLSRESCNMYDSYISDNNISDNSFNSIEARQPLYTPNGRRKCYVENLIQKNNDGGLNNYILKTPKQTQEFETYGRCVKCNSRVLGESSGCTAMDQIYHISCFTCTDCQINLQGKPFYALDGKPYCEYDYLQTLEKCSVCMEPILERILRATGKPYHPQCFTCVIFIKNLLHAVVSANNQLCQIQDKKKLFE